MPPSLFGNVSIAVSDEEFDDRNGRMRVRTRRKRRKALRREELWLWIRKKAMRWWMLLLFLPAVGFFLLELSRMPQKQEEEVTKPLELPAHGNLNRLDHTTRVVGGVRERCLKLLDTEELRRLEFPSTVKRDGVVVGNLVYVTDRHRASSLREVNGTRLRDFGGGTRFNLFTGNQSLRDREESFKVNDTAIVHCGFYSENGGFTISENDRSYMNTCEAVVSTCAFGGGDDLYQPIGMTATSLEKVCYVAFWDEITRSTQELQGKTIDSKHMIGKWRIVIVNDLPFTDQRLNGKIPKMLSHRLFPRAKYSIWVDSKSQIRRDPLGVLEALLWRTNSVLALSEHGARSSIYEEGKAVVKKHKATPEEVEFQLAHYRREGFSGIRTFNGKKALSEASVIIREHTVETNLLMCLWFNEVVRFTSRDQLSFPYVLRRLNIPGINMFPVCTRKDLVNSMGHKKKVKPLVMPV